MPSAHFLVPESETSTHYFYALSRNGRLNDDDLSKRMAEIIRRAFIDEDEPMIRAVEDVMDGREFFSMRPVILETDASGIMARLMLAKMIRDEQQAGANSAPGAKQGNCNTGISPPHTFPQQRANLP